MIEKLGGRKFFGTLLLILLGIAVEILAPKGLTDNVLNLLMSLGGTYIVGNVVNKAFAGKSKVNEAVTVKINNNDVELPVQAELGIAQRVTDLEQTVLMQQEVLGKICNKVGL